MYKWFKLIWVVPWFPINTLWVAVINIIVMYNSSSSLMQQALGSLKLAPQCAVYSIFLNWDLPTGLFVKIFSSAESAIFRGSEFNNLCTTDWAYACDSLSLFIFFYSVETVTVLLLTLVLAWDFCKIWMALTQQPATHHLSNAMSKFSCTAQFLMWYTVDLRNFDNSHHFPSHVSVCYQCCSVYKKIKWRRNMFGRCVVRYGGKRSLRSIILRYPFPLRAQIQDRII